MAKVGEVEAPEEKDVTSESEVVEEEVVEAEDSEAEEAGFAESFGEEAPAPQADAEDDEDDDEDTEAEEDDEDEESSDEPPEGETDEETDEEESAEEIEDRVAAMLESLPKIGEKADMSQAQIQKINGKLGELNRTLQELKAAKASGPKLNFSKDTFKKLGEDYPELAELLSEDLSAFNTPEEEVKPAVESTDTTANDNTLAMEQKFEMKLLGLSHPDFRQVVGSVEFRNWMTTLPADEAAKLDTTWDSEFIGSKIDAFKAATKPAASKEDTEVDTRREKRRKRLKDGLTPKGSSKKLDKGITTEDEGFDSAFNKA